MRVNSRSAWNARKPKSVRRIGKTPRLWLHHSVTGTTPAASQIKAIQNYHMNTRRWQDIAYSFLVDVNGGAWTGRGALVAGGHTAGDNTTSHAICAIGNFDANQPPAAMIEGIAQLVAHGYRQGWWSTNVLTGGHREAPGASTACPGRYLFALIPQINARSRAILGGAAPKSPAPSDTTVRSGSRGTHVRELQSALNAIGDAGLVVDGIAGSGTVAAIRNFQRSHGMTVDGIVGPKTWDGINSILVSKNKGAKPAPSKQKPTKEQIEEKELMAAKDDIIKALKADARKFLPFPVQFTEGDAEYGIVKNQHWMITQTGRWLIGNNKEAGDVLALMLFTGQSQSATSAKQKPNGWRRLPIIEPPVDAAKLSPR